MVLKASEVRIVHPEKDKTWYEIFTTPEEVRKALEEQGEYPEICLTIEEVRE